MALSSSRGSGIRVLDPRIDGHAELYQLLRNPDELRRRGLFAEGLSDLQNSINSWPTLTGTAVPSIPNSHITVCASSRAVL